MKLITILFITAGWIVSLVPMMILTLSNLTDGRTGLALCFFAIILFITGQFYDLLTYELEDKKEYQFFDENGQETPAYNKRHSMDTSGVNPNLTSFNDKDVPGRY